MQELRVLVMTVHYSINTDAVDHELDRLINTPRPRDVAALDGVLLNLFDLTQTIVHVETGSLKASGSPEAEYDRLGKRWKGSITYGGPSPGSIKDPVKYAWYERSRKGSHDFMRPTELAHPAFSLTVLFIVAGRA